MENVMLEALENLGLQLLFSHVGCFVGTRLPEKISSTERRNIVDLNKFIGAAICGLNLVVQRYQKKKELSPISLEESVKAERAFLALSPVLPSDFAEAKDVLQGLLSVLEKIISGRCRKLNGGQKKLHSFCRKFLSHLHQEYVNLNNFQVPKGIRGPTHQRVSPFILGN